MAQLVKMHVAGGASLLIEVADTPEDFLKSTKGGDLIRQVHRPFDETLQRDIIEHARVLIGAFQQLAAQPLPPSKATVEFGLKLTATGEVFTTKTLQDASFKIVLEWQLPSISL